MIPQKTWVLGVRGTEDLAAMEVWVNPDFSEDGKGRRLRAAWTLSLGMMSLLRVPWGKNRRPMFCGWLGVERDTLPKKIRGEGSKPLVATGGSLNSELPVVLVPPHCSRPHPPQIGVSGAHILAEAKNQAVPLRGRARHELNLFGRASFCVG